MKYNEVTCVMDKGIRFWKVNALSKETAQETTIAFIDDLTGRVVYADPDAETDEPAQSVIQEKVQEILNKNILVTISDTGTPSLSVKTDVGTLSADPEEESEVGYNAMYIGMAFDGNREMYHDFASVKVEENVARLYAWPDILNDDPENIWIIDAEDIEELRDIMTN